LANNWVDANPAMGVGKLKTSRDGAGFLTWTPSHLAKFERHWAIGTRQRLAYEIFLCTGLRRSDVVKFGKGHIEEGLFTVTPQKTEKFGMSVTAEVPPRLLNAILATPTAGDIFMATNSGDVFSSAQSFGNWFSKACNQAGVPGSAHGIRKCLATMAAEGGATEAQLNGFFGWSHRSRESAVYINKADRAKLSAGVAKILAHTLQKTT
jgi:integrase